MAINAWWAEKPEENYWMEITDRDELGNDVTAPQWNGAGREEWSYILVTYVKPGDIVFHWHKTLAGEPALVGWSEAVGPLSTSSMDWLAHGTRGRARGRASHVPTWTMELGGFTELDAPLTLRELNARREDVLAAISATARRNPGSVYAPFYDYGGRALRAQQAYLTKMPANLVTLLARFSDLAGAPTPTTGARRAGRATAPSTQGRQQDPALRRAIERHAVELAKQHYYALGATDIKELGKPYDLFVELDGEDRHVEVKGATAKNILTVQLTMGEVDHAGRWAATDLFVVDGIEYREASPGTFVTSGGTTRIWSDWEPELSSLLPTQYRYELPR